MIKRALHKNAGLISIIVTLTVFIGWLSLVGNPHVVETVIGVIIAVIAGFYVFIKCKKNEASSLIAKANKSPT